MKATTWAGVIGMVLVIAGTFFDVSLAQKLLFFVGTLLLAITAYADRHPIFGALVTVLILGSGVAFFPVSLAWKAAPPIIVALALIYQLIKSGQLNDLNERVGATGIIVLAIGYAISHPAVYLAGGVLVTLYASVSFARGVKIGIIWAVMNGVFSCSAGWALLR